MCASVCERVCAVLLKGIKRGTSLRLNCIVSQKAVQFVMDRPSGLPTVVLLSLPGSPGAKLEMLFEKRALNGAAV